MIKSEVNEGKYRVEISGKGGDIFTEFSGIIRQMFETFPELMVRHAIIFSEIQVDKSKAEKHTSPDLKNM